MLRYALYARKSEEDAKLTEKSISEQIEAVAPLAEGRGLIVRRYEESRSAKIPGRRELFNDMVRRVEKGEVNGLLCWQVNRLARNMLEGGKLAQLLVDGKILEIRTPFGCYTPKDNILPLVIDTATAAQYSRDLTNTVKRSMEGNFIRGGLNYKARQGYRNERDPFNHKRGIVVRDDYRFTLIRKAWDMMLTGAYTPVQVVGALNSAWSYRTKPTANGGGKPLSRTTAYTLFADPFYAGYVKHHGEIRKGGHEPMVTEAEFQAVQEFLGRSQRHQRIRRHGFAFTGLMRCGYCGSQVTADIHVRGAKRYTHYHCSDSKGTCTKQGLSEALVEKKITQALTRITVSEDLCQIALANILRSLETKNGQALAVYEGQHEALEGIETQLDNLEKMWLTGLMTDPARYKRRQDELTTQQNRMVIEADKSRTKLEQARANAHGAVSYICHARDTFMVGDAARKREIAHALGIEYAFYGREKHIEIVIDPLLAEVVRFIREKIEPLEHAISGSGSRLMPRQNTGCQSGGPEGTLIDIPQAMLSLLWDADFPEVSLGHPALAG